ncbi:MAG: ABC transporter ATP-binding protein [Clostridia bacterium]|nr:ABC transporter ATP-binding protein [Clostridia bacterium]
MLRLKNVRKVFQAGTVNEKVALAAINLEIPAGDFVTIIGSNGAGKSTLLNVIAGVYPVDAGRIYLDDQDVTGWAEHVRARLMGRVFQDPLLGTAASMTIEENLAMALRRGEKRRLRKGITAAERALFRERLAELGLGLENRLNDRVRLLSGGQRQALTLLMATLKKPQLLLLDEHTAALDPKTGEKVLDLTIRLVEEHRLTTLMVTHNLHQALRAGNRTLMMDEGQIILDVRDAERQRTTVHDLLALFEKRGVYSDKLLLANAP